MHIQRDADLITIVTAGVHAGDVEGHVQSGKGFLLWSLAHLHAARLYETTQSARDNQ